MNSFNLACFRGNDEHCTFDLLYATNLLYVRASRESPVLACSHWWSHSETEGNQPHGVWFKQNPGVPCAKGSNLGRFEVKVPGTHDRSNGLLITMA